MFFHFSFLICQSFVLSYVTLCISWNEKCYDCIIYVLGFLRLDSLFDEQSNPCSLGDRWWGI